MCSNSGPCSCHDVVRRVVWLCVWWLGSEVPNCCTSFSRLLDTDSASVFYTYTVTQQFAKVLSSTQGPGQPALVAGGKFLPAPYDSDYGVAACVWPGQWVACTAVVVQHSDFDNALMVVVGGCHPSKHASAWFTGD